MTELKTLKDFTIGLSDFESVRVQRLKNEAIKWRKFFDVERKIITREDWDNFFNITSEDLK